MGRLLQQACGPRCLAPVRPLGPETRFLDPRKRFESGGAQFKAGNGKLECVSPSARAPSIRLALATCMFAGWRSVHYLNICIPKQTMYLTGSSIFTQGRCHLRERSAGVCSLRPGGRHPHGARVAHAALLVACPQSHLLRFLLVLSCEASAACIGTMLQRSPQPSVLQRSSSSCTKT